MEKYTNNSIHSRRGNTTVYTIAVLLVVGFIGTALLRMGRRDLIGGIDYYKATEARVAAKAGLQKFEHIIENLPDSIVQIVYDMAIDSQKTKWIIGDADSYENLFGKSEYRVQAKAFDPKTFIMHVESEAKTANSRATINAVYHLGNLLISQDTGLVDDFALYIGEVSSFSMLGPIDIDGGTYINGNVNWDLNASGSRFRGPFQTSNETNHQIWRGDYTFDTVAYFGTEVRFDGGGNFTMLDLTGFDPDSKMTGMGNKMVFHNTVWTNANITGAISLDAQNHRVVHNTSFNPESPSPGWVNAKFDWSGLSGAKSMDLKDSLGIKKNVCMPDVDLDVISSVAVRWSKYADNSAGLLPADVIPPTGGSKEIDGKMANAIYDYAYSQNLLWNEYAVVYVDDPIFIVWGAGEMFSKKIIFVINDGETYQPTASARHFGTTDSAALVLYAAPGGSIQNIGSWEFLRAYIYVDSGATCAIAGNGSAVEPLVGAIHVQDNANLSWYPMITPGTPTITYDESLLTELMTDDFLSFPCLNPDSLEPDSVKFINGYTVETELLGINYY